ncbi:Coatomer, alpha subunit [Metschnikowia bicuspidata var. bicuspidata NRRL YB-4993]|uniref:Coatomer subunit alpha n=1 Tax=Metschnikowia bicuspidata var. bicuspidata NRRL YB-4993 TaxID=869754 RepID=A0A1A0HKG0_9ASCO|nr:Coatomer, alpha subunit [Metschnikowia bicuspidata var. bicuspidata NRRL YB-4993]OBA24293.1 Coatomer, alpha subunit [Metschnikowia bicuspidata var. bicuspidata NRRL YB-4993]
MKMLTKFESKLSRAKGVAFHPKRPWVLVALHLSTIQLWDYRMGTLIHRFEDHEGPVRSVSFHPTQPLFVSGSDDYTIKVWSLTARKCLFTLSGHLDYLRGVSFHHELPWVLSCSDDQTIRIWNWQNRQEIACLTGHNHYVTLAQFHPCDDLIVSASLDQTVRVWDIFGLRKKHLAPAAAAHPFEDQMLRKPVPQQDIFGNVNAVVKFVLEGHDKGVNSAAFHPSLPLIVSAGDDRLVKMWRMNDTKAWEVDTCRGHTGNVLSAVFHPHQDLILSVSDDKTIRVWDLNKRTAVKQFRRENDRFWLVASHPTINLFATCHDSGIMVFKLERERPAHTVFLNTLYFVNSEKQVQTFDYHKDEASLPMLSLKKIGKTWALMRTVSYNQSDNSLLVTHGEGDNAMYALVSLPKHVTGAIEPTDVRLGEGCFACFISRNRFVTFVKASKVLYVKDMANNVTKTIQLDASVVDVLYGGAGRVLLVKAHSVVNYDVQQRKELGELSVNNVKYVSWSPDGLHLALLAKHTITIATKDLALVTSMHETIRVKSAAWDDSGVLLYSTLNHIKYTLLNGDNGIIKTLENTMYITRVSGSKVYCLNRAGQVEILPIDPAEYRFKKSLVNKNFNEVLRIIQTSNLVGQSIIAYLQKKGYPEVALQFVQDPESRFDLALECGDLVIAETEANKLKNNAKWERLGHEALLQGNVEVVERVYQQLEEFDKLSFLYLYKGDKERLDKMSLIANARSSVSALVQNTLYNNDVVARIDAYLKVGMFPLAYTLAASNGMNERANQILEAAGINASDIQLPELEAPVQFAYPEGEVAKNWPIGEGKLSFFESALVTGKVDDLSIEDEPEPATAPFTSTNAFEVNDAAFDDEIEEDDGGWDMEDEDLDIPDEFEDIEDAEDATPLSTKTEDGANGEIAFWLRNNKTAAGYVAAGAFEQAATLLNKQLAVVNFSPLRKRFLEVYTSNKLYLPGVEDLPAMKDYIREHNDEDDPKKFRPFIPGYDSLEEKLSNAFKLFKTNNLPEAINVFRDIIYTIAVMTVDDEEQEAKCDDILILCREYILGLSIELERRALDPSDVKRNLELAAYFTRAKLQNAHRVNALQVAMLQSFKNKNYTSASYFAGELLSIISTGAKAEQAQKIRARAESISSEAHEIDFDPYAEFDICCASFTPIYNGTGVVSEALVGAKYKLEYKGQVCRITNVTRIGAPASGLRIKA